MEPVMSLPTIAALGAAVLIPSLPVAVYARHRAKRVYAKLAAKRMYWTLTALSAVNLSAVGGMLLLAWFTREMGWAGILTTMVFLGALLSGMGQLFVHSVLFEATELGQDVRKTNPTLRLPTYASMFALCFAALGAISYTLS
jgi:hypothetical protein